MGQKTGAQGFSGENGKNNLEDLDVDGRIIFKLVFKK